MTSSSFSTSVACFLARTASILLVAAMGPLGCGVEAEGEDGRSSRAKPVELVTVEARSFRRTVEGIGTLEAIEMVEIMPEIAALVERIHVEEGSRVDADALLFSLEDDMLRSVLSSRQAALDAARVDLDNARRELKQIEELRDRGAATDDEFDDAEAAVEQAKAEVARLEAEVRVARTQIDDTRLRAPLAGEISEIQVDEGDFVDAGDRLATLLSDDGIEIAFTVPERAADDVELGQRVEARIDAFPDDMFDGRLSFVSPGVRPSTRDLLVKAVLENDDGRLTPGMFADARIIVDVLEDRPAIPEEALVATRAGYSLFVVEDGVARRRDVTIGLREPGVVEIRRGVEPGEIVVRTGHISLREGDRVREAGAADGRRDASASEQGA